MKCEVTSNTTHGILISQEIGYNSYKEICRGERKKVNLGYAVSWLIKNKKLKRYTKSLSFYIYATYSYMTYYFEFLEKFFSIHNIEPNWLDCERSYGHYDDNLGGWTGCMGKV